MRDSLYAKIIAGLDELRDGHAFQECAIRLLQEEPRYSGLVLVGRGPDGGFDGAVADGKGEPLPVICTIAERPERNLEKSLEAIAKSSNRRRVIFVTCRRITPQKRRKLQELARQRGFTLVQIHDRDDVAWRLYRTSTLRQELLPGVAGKPAALSIIPRTRRPLLDLELVGRDDDVAWLKRTSGDRVISGEPGSGKTFLLYKLAREGFGLFLASDDEEAIADAIRDQRPPAIIVDDAHVAPERLERLRHLRQEIGARFAIVATTWKQGEPDVVDALGGASATHLRRLELLTRDEILQLIRQVGVAAPDVYLGMLVDQAANKPGLAVTLATLWLHGDDRDRMRIVRGEALSEHLIATFKRYVGFDASRLLAVFALGGRRGMSKEAVGDYLGISRREVAEKTAVLAFGGVLSEAGDALSVRPHVLRASLLRDVFFSGSPIDLGDYRELLDQAPSRASAVEAMVTAAQVGGRVRRRELQELLLSLPEPDWRFNERTRTQLAWRRFATLGREEACWALDHYPGDIADVAREALNRAPEETVRRLLEEAEGLGEARPSEPHHPLRVLKDWLESMPDPRCFTPAHGRQALARRKYAVRVAKSYLADGGDREVAVRALCLALSPDLQYHGSDPGAGMSIIISSAVLPADRLREMKELWRESAAAIGTLDHLSWPLIRGVLGAWNYGSSPSGATAAQEQTMKELRARMLRDLATRVRPGSGVAVALKRSADRAGVDLPLEVPEPLNTLYPELWSTESVVFDERMAKARALAEAWRGRSPEDVAAELADYETEASVLDAGTARLTPDLCKAMAAQLGAEEAAAWLEAFLERKLEADLVEPFLNKAMQISRQAATSILAQLIKNKNYAWLAMHSVLQLEEPGEGLLEQALDVAPDFTSLIDLLCLRKQIPTALVGKLLQHPSPAVSLAAAVGIWNAQPKGEIEPALRKPWRDAILRASDSNRQHRDSTMNYWLGEILHSDPELASDWLKRKLGGAMCAGLLVGQGPVSRAIEALNVHQRMELLDSLGDHPLIYDLVTAIVGRHAEVYRHLLSLSAFDESVHLAPLIGFPHKSCLQFAELALDAGKDPRAVASGAIRLVGVYVGPMLRYYEKKRASFENLLDHPREEIREVARHGIALAEKRIQAEKAWERQRALHRSRGVD